MLLLRRARVPMALLPEGFGATPSSRLDPTVLCDIAVDGDWVSSIRPASQVSPESDTARILDVDNAIVLPGLVDAHTHLDKTHTWFRAPNTSGTFAEALDVLWRDKENWSEADLLRRGRFALQCAWAHGTRILRTHVDSAFPGAGTSHEAMVRLREEWRGRIELQTVPLCRMDEYATAQGEAIADLAMAHGASALGGFPTMSPELPRLLDRLCAIASERGVGVDLHVDENGDPGAECLRCVAEAVLRNDFSHPVVCGHCCSLAVQSPERQRFTIDLVKEAGVGVVALPLCNLYLQDRRVGGFPRAPIWRGLTLVRDLIDAGVSVACASDNVRDAFYAYGDYDMLEVYTQSVRLAHLDGDLAGSIRVVTTTAADLVGRSELGRIAPGSPARLVVTRARTVSELLSRATLHEWLVDGEVTTQPCLPDFRELSA